MIATMPTLTVEWIEWDAPEGRLRLADGRFVDVHCGDELMAEFEDGDLVCFLEHAPRTLH